jgi:hypothetical protein
MAQATVTIEGTSALLMKKYPTVPIEGFDKKEPQEQAELSAYRIPGSKELYIPGVAVQRALVKAATYSKGKGRASLQKVSAACLMVLPEYIGLGTDKFTLDSRPVVIPATKGRIMRHRPRIDKWRGSFGLEWDETLMSEEQVKKIVEDMGKRVGLLEFRPSCNGPYGRSKIVKWEKEPTKAKAKKSY